MSARGNFLGPHHLRISFGSVVGRSLPYFQDAWAYPPGLRTKSWPALA
jgi:hypothetical protein